MVVFNESNVIGAKIDNLTSMLGNLSTQNGQPKPFKPQVYQGRGWPLTNSGRGDQCHINNNRNRFYGKGRSYDKSLRYNRNNQNFKGRNNVRDDRKRGKYNRGDRRNFKDRGSSYDKSRSSDRDNRGRFSRNRRDSGSKNRGGLTFKGKKWREKVSLL